MPNLATFKVSTVSRFPRRGSDYIAAEHRYRPGYVRPELEGGWILVLDAFPGRSRDNDGTAGRRRGRSAQEARALLRAIDAVSYDWTITERGGSWRREVSTPIHGTKAPWRLAIRVPAPGTYDITLVLRVEPGDDIVHRGTFRLRDLLVVSVGDSYASGEGTPDVPGEPIAWAPDADWYDAFDPMDVVYKVSGMAAAEVSAWMHQQFTTASEGARATFDMNRGPVWLEREAHRSLRCGPALAARGLEDPRKGDVVTFLSFARSGTTIRDGLLGPRRDRGGHSLDGWIGDIGQLQELKRAVGSKRIDALILSAGGHDLGFTGPLAELVSGDEQWWTHVDARDPTDRERVMATFEKALDQLDVPFQELARWIDTRLNVGRVYLTEYPQSFFDVQAGGQAEVGGVCGFFGPLALDLDREDATFLRNAAAKLNAKLEAIARTHHWIYVGGIAEAFAGSGYCTGDESLYVQVEESMVVQGDTGGTMHPNASGHQVYGRAIEKAVRKHTAETEESVGLEPGPSPRALYESSFTVS